MIVDLRDILPLVTIVGAACAPVLATIWAGRLADHNARNAAALAEIAASKVMEVKVASDLAATQVSEVKSTLVKTSETTKTQLGEIHALVNNQLSEAVARFDAATTEIAELKLLVRDLQSKVPHGGL